MTLQKMKFMVSAEYAHRPRSCLYHPDSVQALEHMTHAILMNDRGFFHDIVDFGWRYDMQGTFFPDVSAMQLSDYTVELEYRTHKAFREQTVQGVIAAATKMKDVKGWTATYTPLATVVR